MWAERKRKKMSTYDCQKYISKKRIVPIKDYHSFDTGTVSLQSCGLQQLAPPGTFRAAVEMTLLFSFL